MNNLDSLTKDNVKVLSLMSGGLDSLLATKLMLQQGLHVEGINFFTGFTGVGCVAIKKPQSKQSQYDAQWVADQLGIKLHVVDVVQEFKQILAKPHFGYGANLNPCLDCKRFMVEQAMLWLKKHNFTFLVTGEVLGQRPMSQRKDTFPIVAKNTEDLLLRPLSAKLLEPTLPERLGLVNRDLLCDFGGRGRKPQIALAKKLGFEEFPQPAGGCVLTDEGYSRRMQHLWQKNGSKTYTLDELYLLQVGRHLGFNDKFTLIVGRDETENNFLEKYQHKYISMYSPTFPGSRVLCLQHSNNNKNDNKACESKNKSESENENERKNLITDDDKLLMAQITAYFGKGREQNNVDITLIEPSFIEKQSTEPQLLKVVPIKEIPAEWYV